MKITKENMDQWMFKSVEGELTSEQSEQLSSFVVMDPYVEIEFENWQEAHLRDIQIEEYKNLEAILKKRSFYWKNRYTFFLGLLIGIFAWLPFAFKSEKNTNTEKTKSSTIKVEEKEVVKRKKDLVLEKRDTKVPLLNDVVLLERGLTKEVSERAPIKEEEKAEMLQKVSIHEVTILPAASSRKLNKKKLYPKPFLTKKDRRLERKKKKAIEDKSDIKYLKGDGPGVIPMNHLGL